MTTHELKTWPEYFTAIVEGRKRYEIRKNDRGYRVGDILHLREWAPRPQNCVCNECGAVMNSYDEYPEWQHDKCGGLVVRVESRGYTGREVNARVLYMTPGGSWGLPRETCVLSIEVLP